MFAKVIPAILQKIQRKECIEQNVKELSPRISFFCNHFHVSCVCECAYVCTHTCEAVLLNILWTELGPRLALPRISQTLCYYFELKSPEQQHKQEELSDSALSPLKQEIHLHNRRPPHSRRTERQSHHKSYKIRS